MVSYNHDEKEGERKSTREIMSFIDKQGFLVFPSEPAHMKVSNRSEKSGEAYAFFYCDAPKQKFREIMPRVFDFSETPGSLEISLKEGINPQDFRDSELKQIANNSKEKGLNYCLRARDHGAKLTNQGVAGEVNSLLIQAYQSRLYQPTEKFRGAIFYKQGDKYLTRE